jgi:FkbM family methyltransferase
MIKTILNSPYYNSIRFNALVDWMADLYSGFIKRNLAFYQSFLQQDASNRLVFDIGANKGHKVKVFCKMGFNVIAVDPEPKCLETLHFRFANDKQVTIVPMGVSDKPGTLELNIYHGRSGLNTFSNKWTQQGANIAEKKVSVPVTTLDDLMKQYGVPYFIKIDVEGYEWNVIKGMTQAPEYLSFEANFPEFISETQAIINHLQKQYADVAFNYSIYDKLEAHNWINAEEMLTLIASNQYSYMEIVCKITATIEN